jgi:hypothetical protein
MTKLNQIIIEGVLRTGKEIFPNEEKLAGELFIAYPDNSRGYAGEDIIQYSIQYSLLTADEDILKKIDSYTGREVRIVGRLRGGPIDIEYFSVLKS